MRILHTIATRWTPYSVMFSRDGTRLAIGGGTWYGSGGIVLFDVSTSAAESFPCDRFADSRGRRGHRDLTVSGVCFSADDAHLAASTWSMSQHYGPTLLFEVTDLRLVQRKTFVHDYTDPIGDSCPTGVLLHNGFAITRNNTSILDDVFAIWTLPRDLRVQTEDSPHHLTNSRMVMVQDNVITGGGGSRALSQWRADLGQGETGKAADGLVCVPVGAEEGKVRVIPVRECSRVTAIGTRPSGASFITGGLDGEMDEWSWQTEWTQRRLQPAAAETKIDLPDLTWATYTPNSVVGICCLCDGERWVSVSAGGNVRIWTGAALSASWQLPVPGSPRSVAAHPTKPWIAIGIKQGGFTGSGSVVVVSEVPTMPPSRDGSQDGATTIRQPI